MSPLEIMRERRAAKKADLDALLALPTSEKRDLTTDEGTKFDALTVEIRQADERITELDAEEQRSAAAASTLVVHGADGAGRPVGGATVTDPEVYARGNRERSYFRDLYKSQINGDRDAEDRLQRHARAAAGTEQRALGNTNATGGSGGELAPPTWLVSDYIKLARAGRVTADLFTKMDVPTGTSSVNIPRIVTGTTVALQSTQNTALSSTDMTTAFVGTGFSTVGGSQLVSQQLIDQSAIDFDKVVTADLAAAYAQNVGTQVWSGAGTGANNNSVVNGLTNATVPAGNVITFTSASPTSALFYSKAAGALASFASNRFASPTHWVMHPRRWFWLLAQTDSNGRPLVVPTAVAYNPQAEVDGGNFSAVAGPVGMFLGLPVVIDPLAPTNFGAGTNQDRVYLIKADDLWLFESTPMAEVFREPYSASLGVLFRLYSYIGTILNRQAYSLGYIDGTGLTPPVF